MIIARVIIDFQPPCGLGEECCNCGVLTLRKPIRKEAKHMTEGRNGIHYVFQTWHGLRCLLAVLLLGNYTCTRGG